MAKKSTTAAESPVLRTEPVVFGELEKLSVEIEQQELALKEQRAALKRLERSLKNKKEEVAEQGESNQQRIESLQSDYDHYSKQTQDLQATKLKMQKEALAEMVSSAKEGVSQASKQVQHAIGEHQQISDKGRELRSNQYWLEEFDKLAAKEALVELLKGDTSELEFDERQREIIQEIEAHVQESGAQNIAEVLDSYLEQETNKLDLAIIRAGKNKKELESFFEDLSDQIERQEVEVTSGEFLSALIELAEQQKQEKLDEVGRFEEELRGKEQELRQVQESAKKWDAAYDVELPADVTKELERRVGVLQKKQDQAWNDLAAADRGGFDTNTRLALELNDLEKEVAKQTKLVKEQTALVDQNQEKFAELSSELEQVKKQAKKKVAKKEVDEPEQEFYLSDTPKYSQLQETIRHRKEINALQREHELAMSSQSDELERLRAENLRLAQAQEQTQRDLQETRELLAQRKGPAVEPTVEQVPKGRSLLDELSELPPEQFVDSPLEEEVRQARATRPDVLLQNKDEEIALLKAKLEKLELDQEEFVRTKENLREIEHERDGLKEQLEEGRRVKQEVARDREEEVDQLREVLENREQALEVQTQEKDRLAREISEERDAHRQELLRLKESQALELGTLKSQLEQAAKPSALLKAERVENEKLKAEVRRLNLDVERYQSQGQRIEELERELAKAKLGLEELRQSKDQELALMNQQLLFAREETAAKQRDLELAKSELASTKLEGTELASQLQVAQQSLESEVGPKQALTEEVARLKREIEENRLVQEQQRLELVGAKERAELATSQQREAYEQQLESLRQDALGKQSRVEALEKEIVVVKSRLEHEQRSHDELLQQNAEQLKDVRAQLLKAAKGSERAVELQQDVDRLSREKQELVSQGEQTALRHEQALSELGVRKDRELEVLRQSQVEELALLQSQLLLAKEESLAKQRDLELAKSELASTKLEGEGLASKLEVAQESLSQGKGNAEALGNEVAQLKEQLRLNKLAQKEQREELERAKKELAALEKENQRVQKHVERAQEELDQIAKPTKKVAREEMGRGQEREHSPERRQAPETVAPRTVAKVSDKVAAVSDDQILQEFRALKERQREVIVGSGAVEGIPKGNEAFHKYASENGALIGSKLDPETARLMNEIEREKYKEIHAKYPYKDIDWQGGKKASISKDGVEICKLDDSVPSAREYSLNGKPISNYRSLDVPLKADGGPMHMSLAVKDSQGNNISAKDAVYLSAHYDDKGKLVEMTTPVPVYFTSQDKESPVCIKQDGRVYTLPINRGKYEEMQQQIAINKGLSVEKTADLSQDQVGVVSTKPVHKAKQVLEGNPEALEKLQRHSSAHHSYPPAHSKPKGNSQYRE